MFPRARSTKQYILTTLIMPNRKSHATAPYLPPPTSPTLQLDFVQLLQATTANPGSRARTSSSRSYKRREEPKKKTQEKISEEEGWDLVDDDTLERD